MKYQVVASKKKANIGNSTLLLIAFSTAFFPRIITYFGVPSVINFVHFLFIPAVFVIVLLTTPVKDRKQIRIVWELLFALGILLVCTIASAFINQAGVINVFLQYMLQAEPFLLLIAVMSIPLYGKNLKRFKNWLLGFVLCNLILAIAQSILLPLGLFPSSGQLYADNIAGVFSSRGGSAGNYVSCSVSLYFGLYCFHIFKTIPLWIRISVFMAAIYQTYISDSKQIILTFLVAWILLVFTKSKEPLKLLLSLIPIIVIVTLFMWTIKNSDAEFLSPYRNWIQRSHIYAPDGDATQTKLAAFRIIPSYYKTHLNWFFGLGPGHTVTRLGGWMMKRYSSLLIPLGATIHPASNEVFQVVTDGWIAQESTIFFPLFTWAGIWGDLGFIGLGSYLYIGFILWHRVCIDDFCKYIVLTNVVLGFILTQMEEPGQMLTVACFLGLRWQEEREKRLISSSISKTG